MPNIPNDTNRNMVTYVEGAMLPIDECAIWSGTYQAATGGATSNLGTYTLKSIAPPTPYLSYSGSTACTGEAGIGPSEGLTFIPNGYTGIVNFNVTTTDAIGLESTSNTVSYTLVGPGVLSLNVGPDLTVFNSSYDGVTAVKTGGPPGTPTYQWTLQSAPPGSVPEIIPDTEPDPVITGMDSDGDYVFKCVVTVPPGATAGDSLTITRQGGVVGMSVAATFANTNTLAYARAWTITVTGGTPPFDYEWFDPDSVLSTGLWREGSFTGTSSFRSGTGYMDQCNWPQFGDINVVVTDASLQTASSPFISVDFTCFLEGTPVSLPDGSTINIENLKVGDTVLGTNILTYENDGSDWKFSYPTIAPEPTKIVKIVSWDVTSYININNNVKATSSHPILIYRDYEYQFISLGQVVLTDKLVDKDGGLIDITSIEIINENGKVYLLDTSPFNTYIAAGIVSHNKTANCDPG